MSLSCIFSDSWLSWLNFTNTTKHPPFHVQPPDAWYLSKPPGRAYSLCLTSLRNVLTCYYHILILPTYLSTMNEWSHEVSSREWKYCRTCGWMEVLCWTLRDSGDEWWLMCTSWSQNWRCHYSFDGHNNHESQWWQTMMMYQEKACICMHLRFQIWGKQRKTMESS